MRKKEEEREKNWGGKKNEGEGKGEEIYNE